MRARACAASRDRDGDGIRGGASPKERVLALAWDGRRTPKVVRPRRAGIAGKVSRRATGGFLPTVLFRG